MSCLIEARSLAEQLDAPEQLIIDVGRADTYRQLHIPGAIHIDYTALILGMPPAPGLPPPQRQLEQVFSRLGLRPELKIIAYDDEGGANAGRLLWTLACIGHQRFALLNGGLHAWVHGGFPVDQAMPDIEAGAYPVPSYGYPLAGVDDVLTAIDSADSRLLDARSAEEYVGVRRYSARAGHIPGAINMDWLEAIDRGNEMRFRSDEWLIERLGSLGIERDNEVIVYCQTHHRSSHTYMVLRHLGFERLRAYAGAWAEWGNRPDLPLET